MPMIDENAGCAQEIENPPYRDEPVPAQMPVTAAFGSRAAPSKVWGQRCEYPEILRTFWIVETVASPRASACSASRL